MNQQVDPIQQMIAQAQTAAQNFQGYTPEGADPQQHPAATLQPGMPQPGMPQPGMPQPGMPQPGMPQPGMMLPTQQPMAPQYPLAMPAQGQGRPLTADDMLGGAMMVDAWLKVTKYGLTIGSDTTMFKEIPVRLRMDEVHYCWAMKYGNPAVYEKTYDRVFSVKGEPWAVVMQNAQRVDPKAHDYRSADLPFEMRTTLEGGSGNVLIEEGEILGASVAETGWRLFAGFLKDLTRAGIDKDLWCR